MHRRMPLLHTHACFTLHTTSDTAVATVTDVTPPHAVQGPSLVKEYDFICESEAAVDGFLRAVQARVGRWGSHPT